MTEAAQKAKLPSPHVRREREEFTRRHFFSVAAWGAFFTALGIGVLGTIRYMYPRVLFEPPTTFKAGKPSEYVVGEVSEKFKRSKRVWIVREEGGFYALLAVCTHLGCTPNWLPSENKFKCPCHGSGFRRDGVNFEGPAPRPLERVKITLNEEGIVVIDKFHIFRKEKGEWSNLGAYLRL